MPAAWHATIEEAEGMARSDAAGATTVTDTDISFLNTALAEIAVPVNDLIRRSDGPEQALAVASALTTLATRIYEGLGGTRLAGAMFAELAKLEESRAL